MANKKTTGTGATSKRATPKAKAQMEAKQKPRAAAKKTSSANPQSADTRRPPNTPQMPLSVIAELNHDMIGLKTILEGYAEHLRSLDRRRLNGVGIKHQGFIDRTLELAVESPEFLPHYLTLDKFQDDDLNFTGFRALHDIGKQIQELLWNITIIASDIVYTDALEFYASVREAAKRRVDAAESLHNTLEVFFSRRKHATGPDGQPIKTEKEEVHDAMAFIHGKKDGKFLVENISPKVSGGVHKIIDKTLKDTAEFKDTIEGEERE